MNDLINNLTGAHPHGYPSYNETIDYLDGVARDYPKYVVKYLIGYSYNCLPIYAYQLTLIQTPPAKRKLQSLLFRSIIKEEAHTLCHFKSNAPTGSFRVKPLPLPPHQGAILVTALHHSREPASLTTTLHLFINILASIIDAPQPSSTTQLMRSRVLYYVPFVNPDGYVAIERTGSLKIRKNQRPTCPEHSDSTILNGVDLNRNYASNFRSDHLPCDPEEYEGSHAFSEPETRAIRRAARVFQPVVALNFHAYGDLWTRPWNCCPDKSLTQEQTDIFHELKSVLVGITQFGNAPSLEALGYAATGEADDYLLEEFGIISMSPEVGPEEGGFYPNKTLIQQMNVANADRSLRVMQKVSMELSVTLDNSDQAIKIFNSGLRQSRNRCQVHVIPLKQSGAAANTTGDDTELDGWFINGQSDTYVASGIGPGKILSKLTRGIASREVLTFSLPHGSFPGAAHPDLEVCFEEEEWHQCYCGKVGVGIRQSPLHHQTIFDSTSHHPCTHKVVDGRRGLSTTERTHGNIAAVVCGLILCLMWVGPSFHALFMSVFKRVPIRAI